jgi:hypothetical protein
MDLPKREEEILRNYVRVLGIPTKSIAFHDLGPAPDPIIVAEFAPPQEDYDWVYATIGVSRKPMPDIDKSVGEVPYQRIELILYANEADSSLRDIMLKLALIPFVDSSSLAPGDTVVGIAEEGVVKGSPLTEMLITHAYSASQEFQVMHHSDGSHTDILWAIPIHVSERIYAKEHGYKALEKLFQADGTDTSDFWRSPVV